MVIFTCESSSRLLKATLVGVYQLCLIDWLLMPTLRYAFILILNLQSYLYDVGYVCHPLADHVGALTS